MACAEWQVVHPDARVVRLAAAQRNAVQRSQLLVLGLGEGAIDHRLATGRLTTLHRGVYAVGPPSREPLAAETAALLAVGPGAVLSHASAAAAWGLGDPPRIVQVTSPSGRTRDGIRVHRTELARDDTRRKHHLRVTSPARTLLSLADAVDLTELERMVGEAASKKLTTEQALHEAIARGGRGAAKLRSVLDRGPAFTRSEAERRLLTLIRAARLPRPQVNARIGRHEVDFAWPDRRLVVEVDGYAFHASRSAVEHDRRREADLDAAGFEVLRCTWRQITTEPEALLVRLARRL